MSEQTPAPPHHERFSLRHFTAFESADFVFVPGINVFVGENGTGKTHVMKAMFAWQYSAWLSGEVRLTLVFKDLFQIPSIRTLIRNIPHPPSRARCKGTYGRAEWKIDLEHEEDAKPKVIRDSDSRPSRPVFIPAVDMLAHTRSFVSTYDELHIDFDRTHRDIVSLILAPELRELSEIQRSLVEGLERAIQGRIELDGERFYLVQSRGKLPVTVVGEGLRKVSTLMRLVQCGWLRPGTTLFWDEPEVNLNPVLMDNIVDALVVLAEAGVQIILATHSYLILEEIADRARPNSVRYFGFAPGDRGVEVVATDRLASLEPNPILRQYEDLTNRKLSRAFQADKPA